MIDKFAEQGTKASGYEEKGPYHCKDCIHKTAVDEPYCIHPEVISDPEMKDKLVTIGDTKAVEINLEEGCCKYVNQNQPKLIFLLMRHGSTNLNETDAYRGWTDIPLSPLGIEQAFDASNFLTDFPITKIVASPMNRTITTALIAAHHIQSFELPIEQDKGLMPINVGKFTGLPKKENRKELRSLLESGQVVPGGESLKQFQDRIKYVMDAQTDEYSGLTLFVIHSSCILGIQSWLHKKDSGTVADSDDVGVEPGSIVGIYLDSYGNTSTKVLFGALKKASFTS
jgi:broad specificity phosphatase PhoE